jgi:hypothetical protein
MVGMEKYPGIGNRLIICDVCGFKFRVKQTTRIADKYNTLNQLIVCHKCNERSNPQFYPFTLPTEKLLSDPSYVRPESETLIYAPNPGAILPGQPRNLQALADPLSSYIYLIWEGPQNVGSQPILGYIITRSDPQYSYQFAINANTQSAAAYYLDITSDVSGSYLYQVAAISAIGTGPYSDGVLWQYPGTSAVVEYITGDDFYTIAGEDGTYLIGE